MHLAANVTKRQITRFKWWFEGVERILRNRQDEFGTMRLAAEDVAKWTSGYVQGAELIFIIRGMVTEFSMMARVKLRSDYHREHVWASTAEVQQFVDAPMLTEEERGAHAKRAAALAAKKRAKRERQRKSRWRAREALPLNKRAAAPSASPLRAQTPRRRALHTHPPARAHPHPHPLTPTPAHAQHDSAACCHLTGARFLALTRQGRACGARRRRGGRGEGACRR